MSKKHHNDGPTFSKSPKKPKLLTPDERGILEARKEVELEQTERDAAKSRAAHQRMHKDPEGWIQEIIEKRRLVREK